MIRVRFTFCACYVSTKPTAFSSCVLSHYRRWLNKVSNRYIGGSVVTALLLAFEVTLYYGPVRARK